MDKQQVAQWESRVDGWIGRHREELVADIVKLVRIKSVSDSAAPVKPYGQGCRDALNEALAIAKGYGFETSCFDGAIGCAGMGRPGGEIGFWGHLDVVPEGDNWDYPPYEGIVRDGLIIGRGAQDNKGQTMAVLYVMRCIQELGIPTEHNYRLYFGTAEETGMQDVERYARERPLPPFSIVADSNFPVCIGEKGMLTVRLDAQETLSGDVLELCGGVAANVIPDAAGAVLRRTPRVTAAMERLKESLEVSEDGDRVVLTARGVAGHTAFPENSRNAVRVLTKALCGSGALSDADREILGFCSEINADYWGTGLGIAGGDGLSGRLTCVGSVIGFRGGRLSLTVNIRFPVTDDAGRILRGIEASCKKRRYTPRPNEVDPAHLFPADHPVVGLLGERYRSVTGESLPPFVLPGGTYARKLKNSISFGMGFGGAARRYHNDRLFRPGHGGAHGPDEYTVIELLLKAIKIYVLGLLDIDGLTF